MKKKTRSGNRKRRQTNPYNPMMKQVTDMGKFAIGASIVAFMTAKVSDAIKK